MALTVFLVLNGLAVAFLLYVLANFWKDGRQARERSRKLAPQVMTLDKSEGLAPGRLTLQEEGRRLSVIPFPETGPAFRERPGRAVASREILVVPARRVSTR
jgi:hypothetical protein